MALLTRHFSAASLDGFGFADTDVSGVRAAGAVLDYLRETQKVSLDHIDRLIPYRTGVSLEIDEATRRSLEISRTLRDGKRDGSLLSVIDRTVTAMGSRLLAEWIASPLANIAEINGRLDAVEELTRDDSLRRELREHLRGIYDLERLLARAATGRATPRDLAFIGRTLAGLPPLKTRLAPSRSDTLQRLEAELDLCPDLRSELEAALVDDCPLTAKEGGVIRAGYREDLENLRELAAGGKRWIAQYQAEIVERDRHRQSEASATTKSSATTSN